MKRKTVTTMLALLLTAAVLGTAWSIGGVSARAEGNPSPLPYLPPIMQEVTDSGEFDSAVTDLLIRVDADLNAVDADGSVIAHIGALETGERTPVYYVSNAVAATNLAQYLVSQSVTEAVVASAKPELLAKVREKAVSVSGMLDCRSLPAETQEDWDEIRRTANAAWARAVLLSGSVSAEGVRFLRRLSFAVWAAASNATETALALGAGANGLLSQNPAQTVAAARELGSGVFAPPIIIAHRGLSGLKRKDGSEYHENTVEAAWAAYTEGGADTVEIDVYLSADNEIIVMHDPDLNRTTNGTGKVEEMTLSEIRQYRVVGSSAMGSSVSDPIPTLDDFMQKFKGEDCNLFIEIKGSKTAIIQRLREKVEQYDFSSQCTIIAFDSRYLAEARKQMPEISLGFLYDYKGEAAGDILRKVNPFNATFNPSYTGLNTNNVAEWNGCGITVWPWTFRNQDVYKDYFFMGMGGVTLDYCGWMTAWVKRLVPESNEIAVSPQTKFVISCERETFGGARAETAYSFKVLGGDLELSMDENGYFSAAGEGSATIVLAYANAQPAYTLLSEPILITSKVAPPATAPQEESQKSGCGSSANATAGVMAILLLCASALAADCKRRRNGVTARRDFTI